MKSNTVTMSMEDNPILNRPASDDLTMKMIACQRGLLTPKNDLIQLEKQKNVSVSETVEVIRQGGGSGTVEENTNIAKNVSRLNGTLGLNGGDMGKNSSTLFSTENTSTFEGISDLIEMQKPQNLNKETKIFLDHLNTYTSNLFHSEDQCLYNPVDYDLNSLLSEDSTSSEILPITSTDRTSDPNPVCHERMKSDTTEDDCESLITKMDEDGTKLEEQIFLAHREYFKRYDAVNILEIHLKESCFLRQVTDAQQEHLENILGQRKKANDRMRNEHLLVWEKQKETFETQESLLNLNTYNFGMAQVRKIIKHQRQSFKTRLISLEERQQKERFHLMEAQRREEKSRLATRTARLKCESAVTKTFMQKECNTIEQHNKLSNFKNLQYLDEYHKIMSTFVVCKFEKEIQLLEEEQLLVLQDQREIGDLIIHNGLRVIAMCREIESLEFKMREALLTLSHLHSKKKLTIQHKSMTKFLESTHHAQKDDVSYSIDVLLASHNYNDAAFTNSDSMLHRLGIYRDNVSFWADPITSNDRSSSVILSYLFRQAGATKMGQFDNSDDSSFETSQDDTEIVIERTRIQTLENSLKRKALVLTALKDEFQHTISEKLIKQSYHLERHHEIEHDTRNDMIQKKERELRRVSKRQNREKASSSSLLAKELTNLKKLQTKEMALQNKAQELEAILSAMLDPMLVSDEQGIIFVANRAVSRLFGYTQEELIGSNLSILMPMHMKKTHDKYLDNYRKTNSPKIIGTTGREVTGRRKDGTEIPLHLSVNENIVNNRRIFVGCLHDLSTSKEKESQLESARNDAMAISMAKSLFLAQMSHEIRTPLHAMLGLSSLLSESQLSKDQLNMVSVIKQCGDTLCDILDDILNYSKYESANFELRTSEVHIIDCIESCVSSASVAASGKNIYLHNTIDPDVPSKVISDASRLYLMVSHIVKNAVKFTENGGVHIRVSVERVDLESESKTYTLKISVRDTGTGVPEEQRQDIFKEFQQLDYTSNLSSGSVFGLAKCSKIAKKMNGSLQLENSELGIGSVFSVIFECKAVDHTPLVEDYRIVYAETFDGYDDFDQSNLYVYYACESNEGRLFMKDMLESIGMQTILFDSMKKAQETVKEEAMRNPKLHYVLLCERESIKEAFNSSTLASNVSMMVGISQSDFKDALTFKSQSASPKSSRSLKLDIGTPQHKRMSSSLQSILDSSITIFLPYKRQALLQSLLSVSCSKKAKEHVDLSALKVLIVEDNKVNQRILSKMLKTFNVDPVGVSSDGQECVDLVKMHLEDSDPFIDIILMDLQMPRMDGYEARSQIFEMCNTVERARPYIVAVTASVSESQRFEVIDHGFDDCLVKPLSKASLKQLLKTLT